MPSTGSRSGAARWCGCSRTTWKSYLRSTSTLRLDAAPRRTLEAHQKRTRGKRSEIFVRRLSGAPPVTVVVQEQDPAPRQPRVEVLQLVTRGLVPVRVQSQQADLFGRVRRKGFLDPALHQMHTMHRVAGRSQVLGDLRLRRRERSGWSDPRSGLSAP